MKGVVNKKFDQNKDLAVKLVATGIKVLKEATTDTLFGIGASLHSKEVRDGTYNGQNKMGKILMMKRNQLTNEKNIRPVGNLNT